MAKPAAKTVAARPGPDGIGRSGRSSASILDRMRRSETCRRCRKGRVRAAAAARGRVAPPARTTPARELVQTVGRLETRPSRSATCQVIAQAGSFLGLECASPRAARARWRSRLRRDSVVRGQHGPGVGLDLEVGESGAFRCSSRTPRRKTCVDEKCGGRPGTPVRGNGRAISQIARARADAWRGMRHVEVAGQLAGRGVQPPGADRPRRRRLELTPLAATTAAMRSPAVSWILGTDARAGQRSGPPGSSNSTAAWQKSSRPRDGGVAPLGIARAEPVRGGERVDRRSGEEVRLEEGHGLPDVSSRQRAPARAQAR